jgi:NAD(P)-dependent dehydrogenase (short-subunit alcohol dehydrogenase family)
VSAAVAKSTPAPPDVSGKVAVITGASRGLGAGLASHFAAAGLHLGLCATHRPSLVMATRPTARGGQVISAEPPLCAAVDVTDYAALDAFAHQVVERFGGIHLWINNAGVLAPIGPLSAADPALVARNIDVNVTGVLHGSAIFAGHVRRRPGTGVLINISSGAGTRPYFGWAAYCAAKAAVDQLTRVLALEEGGHGLSAYAVAPGVIDTDMQAAIRGSRVADFPAVERFVALAQSGDFNSPGWVAEHLLAMAFGPEAARPTQVTVRIPTQPIAGRSG